MFANSTLVRGIYGAAAILLCHVVAQWTGAGYEFDVIPPSRDLDELPKTFGKWDGLDIPIDDATLNVLGADAYVNREYVNAEGDSVGVHLAYWASPEYMVDVAPHHPRECYTGAGWEILEVRRIEVDRGTETLPLECMLLKRNDQQIVTAHWYQMGSFRFTSRWDARGIHRQFWGEPEWPATLKVLLLTTSPGIDAAKPRLQALASEVSDWTAGF